MSSADGRTSSGEVVTPTRGQEALSEPASPSGSPCELHAVWGSCGTCLLLTARDALADALAKDLEATSPILLDACAAGA